MSVSEPVSAPKASTPLLPVTVDTRSAAEKVDPTNQGLTFKFIPPELSLGILEYTFQPKGGDSTTFPIAYMKALLGVKLTLGDHSLTVTEAFKEGHPLDEEFNPNDTVVVSYNEAEAAYSYKLTPNLTLGVTAEDRQKLSGANWFRLLATFTTLATNTNIKLGSYWNVKADEGKPLDGKAQFTWQVVQPLAALKFEAFNLGVAFINEGATPNPINLLDGGWMNNILAAKITH
ncbi:MAG: hypothetical protein WCV91_05665 [Candidatus Margulisiibacteriota bacterium]